MNIIVEESIAEDKPAELAGIQNHESPEVNLGFENAWVLHAPPKTHDDQALKKEEYVDQPIEKEPDGLLALYIRFFTEMICFEYLKVK